MFEFKMKPFKHQQDAFEKSKDLEFYAYLMEMGTGKSKVVLDVGRYLHQKGEIDSMIIIAPKGVYRNWAEDQIPKNCFDHEYITFVWDPRETMKVEKERKAALNYLNPDKLCIFVANCEGFATKKLQQFADKFIKSKANTLVVVDESTTIKTFNAKRTKAIISLGRKAKYRRILTGSPVTNGPLDLYSQTEFLDWNLLGFRSYYAFRARYAVIQTVYMGARNFKKVVGYRRVEELNKKIQPFSYRVTKDECLDLPPKIYETREVELSPEQRKAYEDMKKYALVEVSRADKLASAKVALTQLLRMHQILCGFLTCDDETTEYLKNGRMQALLEVLEEASGKVIIWANYLNNIREIVETLKKLYGENSVVPYYGAIDAETRQENIRKFQEGEARFFVGNPQTGGMGITLTAANTMVYFSNNFKLEDRIQSEDRAHRIGQTNRVTYIDLVVKKTIDEKILKALRGKINIAQVINGDNFREWVI